MSPIEQPESGLPLGEGLELVSGICQWRREKGGQRREEAAGTKARRCKDWNWGEDRGAFEANADSRKSPLGVM